MVVANNKWAPPIFLIDLEAITKTPMSKSSKEKKEKKEYKVDMYPHGETHQTFKISRQALNDASIYKKISKWRVP